MNTQNRRLSCLCLAAVAGLCAPSLAIADTCDAALPILVGQLVNGSTTGLAANGASICGTSNSSPDVYYRYVPTRTAYTRFDIEQGNYDTVLSLHRACPATAANTIACDDDSGTGTFSTINGVLVEAGVPILIRVAGYDGASGTFALRVSEIAPANDLCANVVPLMAGVLVSSSNVQAGNEGAANCGTGGAGQGHDVYYRYTPTRISYASFSIEEAGFDTVISLHTGCPATASNLIACDDDGGEGRLSLISGVPAQPSAPIFVRIAGYSGSSGGFSLRVTESFEPNDECQSATPLATGVVVNSGTAAARPGGEAPCGESSVSPDVYFTYTPARTAYTLFEIEEGNFDTVLSLHSGCPATVANTIACDDDGGAGGLSQISGVLAEPGVPILVRVSGYSAGFGTFSLRASEYFPPNDTCQNAVPLTANVLVNSTNVLAGNEGAANCGFNGIIGGRDVYYSFTPTCTGSYTLETFGDLDTLASIHSGCPATVANLIACDDDNGPGNLSSVTATLTAGTTYRIRIAEFNGSEGTFGVKMTDLSTINNECPQATAIGLGTTAFNNCAAGPVTPEPVCDNAPIARDLWYQVTSTNSEVPLTISTIGSLFDTVLLAYSACPASGGGLLACNDDFGGIFKSLVRVTVPAGSSVWIRVGGYDRQAGAGQLVVTQCLADLAGDGLFPDGIVDGNDFIAFINSFSIGDAGSSPVADVNGDGLIDGNDYVAFINAFAAGC